MAHYLVDYLASSDAMQFSGMFSDGHNKAMFDRRGVLHDKDMGAWEHRGNAIKSWYSRNVIPIGSLDMSFARHDHELK